MRIIATWPDPSTGTIIDQSRDCGPGPYGDTDAMHVASVGAHNAVDVSQSDARISYGLGVVKNARNATAPPRTFSGKVTP